MRPHPVGKNPLYRFSRNASGNRYDRFIGIIGQIQNKTLIRLTMSRTCGGNLCRAAKLGQGTQTFTHDALRPMETLALHAISVSPFCRAPAPHRAPATQTASPAPQQ
jgi:hypothetical protein